MATPSIANSLHRYNSTIPDNVKVCGMSGKRERRYLKAPVFTRCVTTCEDLSYPKAYEAPFYSSLPTTFKPFMLHVLIVNVALWCDCLYRLHELTVDHILRSSPNLTQLPRVKAFKKNLKGVKSINLQIFTPYTVTTLHLQSSYNVETLRFSGEQVNRCHSERSAPNHGDHARK